MPLDAPRGQGEAAQPFFVHPSSDAGSALRSPLVELDEGGVPDDLKCIDRWVAFRLTPPKRPGEKHRKVPVAPRTGRNASATDPRTWGSFEQALTRVRADGLAGVGFVFAADGICGVDLDKCRDPSTGELTWEAKAIVTELNSFTEVSPSGCGLHIYLKAKLPANGRRRGWVELYETERFFTVTGARVPGTPASVEERQAEVEAVHARHIGAKSTRGQARPAPSADDELLARARKSRNGTKFTALWDGRDEGYASASEADLALCSILSHWAGGDAATVDRLFRRSNRMRSKWDEMHGQATYGARTIATAVELKDGRRTRIQVHPGRLPEAVAEAQDLLSRIHPPEFYQRGKQLWRLLRLDETVELEGVKRPDGTLTFHEVDEAYLSLRLAEEAEWYRIQRDVLARCDPPDALVEMMLAAVGRWKFPNLGGFTEAPTIRPDGSILDTPGYDATSRQFLDFEASEFGTIPREPTRGDAIDALKVLRAPFEDFPFVSEADMAAHLAAILTALIRRSLPSAPMFLFDAPTMGTGKSLLATSVSIVATGRPCASMTQGQDSVEDAKRVFSILRQGDLVACIDNVERPLEGADLCTVTTEPLYQGRVLGASKTQKLPSRTLWMGTGNNLIVRGDLVTRIVVVSLDAAVERPEEREFLNDLRADLVADRPRLVRAALTILRAFHVAGRPGQGLKPFGRFEAWSRRVREPLVWLGLPDPLSSAERLRSLDPVASNLRALLNAWREVFGSKPVGVASAIDQVKVSPRGALYEALVEIAGYGRDSIDSRAVGVFLRQYRGRIIDGLRFERGGEAHGVTKWRVVPAVGGSGGIPLSRARETQEGGKSSGAHTDTRAHACKGAGASPPYPPTAEQANTARDLDAEPGEAEGAP